ncbi:MAG: LysM peptidoglycan-binding domain-containing protein [Candidatus Methanoperedens sp.]|nr:LysM peptidoglycan-binding domain-containing protein [Candidatus Methanoperedens sp.]
MNGKTLLSSNRLFLLILALVVLFMIPAIEVSAQAGTLAAINTGRLNVRTGPSIAYPAITSVPYNTEVILLGRATGTTWVQIRLPNLQVGWVNYLYLRSYATLDSLPFTWTAPVPPTNPGVPPAGTALYHTVRSGETLKTIAARYGTTWDVLASLNNLSNPNLIYVGQQLVIRGGTTTPPVVNPPSTGGVHVVQQGETLAIIAARYGTTWAALATANNISNPNAIYAGQRLVIPAGPPAAPRYYTVQQGDGIYAIARRYGISPQVIITANNLWNANLIYPGQVLLIP